LDLTEGHRIRRRAVPTQAYRPIADYGIVGDCRTAALVSSDASIDWCCLPRFDSPSVFARILDWRRGGHFVLRLPLESDGDILSARFRLQKGEQATYVFQAGPPEGIPDEREIRWLLHLTEAYWRSWANRCTYRGEYRDAVIRSALLLKLLTYEPSGSIVAAPTTSLPEHIGGGRNWDYRFTWLRDAAFAADALYLLGFDDIANRFLTWVCDVVQACRTDLQIMYAVEGGRRPSSPDPELWPGRSKSARALS